MKRLLTIATALSLAVACGTLPQNDEGFTGDDDGAADDDTTNDDLVACADPGACDDHNPCTDDWCRMNPAVGVDLCAHTNVAAGASCNDADGCTTGDTCDGAGLCTGSPMVCPETDRNPCTTAECVEGVCTTLPDISTNGTECDDGTVCTTSQCVAGSCVPSPLVCNDADPCTLDACGAALAPGLPDACVSLWDAAACGLPAGPPGADGTDGEDGTDGAPGTPGADGSDGLSCSVVVDEDDESCERLVCEDGTSSGCLPPDGDGTTPPPAPACDHPFGAWILIPNSSGTTTTWVFGNDLTGSDPVEEVLDVPTGGRFYGFGAARSVWAHPQSWGDPLPDGVRCTDRCGVVYLPFVVTYPDGGVSAICTSDQASPL